MSAEQRAAGPPSAPGPPSPAASPAAAPPAAAPPTAASHARAAAPRGPDRPLRLLMVDNYDSFTFNLVQYLAALGAQVEVARNDALTPDEALGPRPGAPQGVDGLVISPGPCTPAEAGVSVPVIQAAAARGVPLLGVCLGHQSLAAALGASIIRAERIMHGKTSPIYHKGGGHTGDGHTGDHAGGGLFQGLPNPFEATRYHSLVVDPGTLPDALEVTAWSDDPTTRVIMGLAHRTLPLWGVQFHPESILTQAGHALLGNFLREVSARTGAHLAPITPLAPLAPLSTREHTP